MATKKNSTKRRSKQTRIRKRRETHAAAKSAYAPNSLVTTVTFRDNGNGKLQRSSMEDASPAESSGTPVEAELVDTPSDAINAEIESEMHDALERLRRLYDGTSSAADRVMVREELNGTVYRHLARPPLKDFSRGELVTWEMQIVYFDTDPIAEAQRRRIIAEHFAKIFGS